MPKFDTFAAEVTSTLSKELVTLITEAPMQSLGDGPRVHELAKALEAIERLPPVAQASRIGAVTSDSVTSWLSALWLVAGDLERSHELSQTIKSCIGSYLHGIMHRREGDFSNAKYWFALAKADALEKRVRVETGGVYGSATNFCEKVAAVGSGGWSDDTELCASQWCEIQALMSILCVEMQR